MPINVDELLEYLGIDYADEIVRKNAERAIRTADAFLTGSLGRDYPVEDPRAKELALIVAADLYENRSYQATAGGNVSAATRRLVDDFSLQLRLEMRRGSYG